jgi:thiol-disulfide isomerase/thioredoxin
LKPGDKCPELKFGKIMNGNRTSASLRDFKSKLVLLDFGATTCLPCLHLMPKLDSLQKQFADRLMIFMITPEKREKIQAFLANNKIGKQSNISFIVEDSMLNTVFHFKSLPHEVWIDPNGYIAAITDHEYVTADNVELVLKGQRPSWPVKLDFAYDTTRSLFDYARERSTKTFSSVITEYLEEIGTREFKAGFDSSFNYLRYINYPLFDLYLAAYRKKTFAGISKRQLDIDSSLLPRLFYLPGYGYKEEWKRNNSYCYEIVFSKTIDPEDCYRKMAIDLDSYFSIHSSLEKRKMKCWVLTRSAVQNKTSHRDGYPLHAIIATLNDSDHFPFIFNETGLLFNEMFGISIPIDSKEIFDQSKLLNSLKEKGFLITEGIRDVEILSIKPRL